MLGGGFPAILIYIYNKTSDNKIIPELNLDSLLLAPQTINSRLWTMGYFETLENQPIKNHDFFKTHCFLKGHPIDKSKISYVDEYGKKLASRHEPCGEYGLVGFMGLDKLISRALEVL